jgi:cytochrome subunit of sulfide dehydrogenase
MKFSPRLLAGLLLTAASLAQAQDANLGRNLAATCANMHQIAKGYTDDQMKLIAAYFAALPAKP